MSARPRVGRASTGRAWDRRRALGAALLTIALAGLVVPGLQAFNAENTSTRSGSANVVATGSSYDGVAAVKITASNILGYTAQTGVNVTNKGSVTSTFTWTTSSDPSGVVTSSTNCAANTAVGSVCSVQFTGPAKSIGNYTFTGTIDGSGSNFRSIVPSITVTVQYCLLGIC